jgi:hypothetical protein
MEEHIMGMIGHYCKIIEKDFYKLKNEEIFVSDFIYTETFTENLKETDFLDIDKAWHAIDFVLTHDPEIFPLADVVLGGREITDEDVGYGSARYLTNEEVKQCHQFIKDITEKEFRSTFNVKEMIEQSIYLAASDEDEDDFFEYVYLHFKHLQDFFEKASTENRYMLLYIS